MGKLHPDYVCSCNVPRLKKHLGEETGICDICNLIFDERLYEMRLRQHVAGYTYETVDDFLREKDPHYRELVSQT